MDTRTWQQVNVTFPDWANAEGTAVDHLAPLLDTAETDGLITSWFFVRKAPCWRIRYLPHQPAGAAEAYVHTRLADLRETRRIQDATSTFYEPESHAFGGAEGMDTAHRLFHLDSRHLLTYLNATSHKSADRRRRELSVLLCSHLMRAAGLDWYEEGDVWARVAEHRQPPERTPDHRLRTLRDGLRRLMSIDTDSLATDTLPPTFTDWTSAFAAAGTELAALATDGRLRRGLRAVLAHHIIFAWNRHGLPHAAQAVLAHTARTVVFGHDPASDHQPHDREPA
ncbi:methyltransferase [Frankia sp. R43]|uniref:thiopeptide-type bacteriocin biosynthesis protein n=1 Tax=Frankia sp. R43 TaxID=269536 RepID=UPI0006CA39DF|nr:thiopeptide-type bacteriocin biosynthesis protein [Frankia sp. R43]KPM50573.1 methyltransferase [Frankia sp. R43]